MTTIGINLYIAQRFQKGESMQEIAASLNLPLMFVEQAIRIELKKQRMW